MAERLREIDFIVQLSYGPEITKNFLARKMNQRIDLINRIIQRYTLTEPVIHFCNITIRTLRILENLVHEDFNPLLENFGSNHFIQMMIKQYENIVHSLAIAFRGLDLFKLDYETPNSLLQKLQTEPIESIKSQAIILIDSYKDDIKLVEACDANCNFKLNLPNQPSVFTRLATIAIEQLDSLRGDIETINLIADNCDDVNNQMEPLSTTSINCLKINLIRLNFIIHMITSDYDKLTIY